MKTNKLLIIPGVLVTITLLTGVILSSTLTHADGNTSVVDELDITVNSACTIKGGPNGTDDSGSSTYTTSINPGNYTELPGSKLVTLCNDPAGYAIYAIGFSGDSYVSETHTDLIGTATTGNIPTGTSGNDSYWAMKLEAVQGLTPPSIVTDFQNYHVIPDTYTKVASYTTPTATASDAGATVQTKYKINISKTQLADTYVGKVKYTIVHPSTAPAPTPPKPYMQDLTLADCQSSASSDNMTVTDRRDENDYTVKYINGQCWMTQNLRLTGTVSATDSNFSGSDFNVSEYSLDSTDSSYTNHCDSTNGYNYACAKDSGSETTGAWYSYYAATAGTISGSSNSSPATSDICPSGWHLPSAPNTTANTDINKLVGNTTSGWQDPTPGLTAFGAVAGGLYYDGSLGSSEYGRWWSATAYDGMYRHNLVYDSSIGRFRGDVSNNRYNGLFLRCVKSA